MSTGPVDAGSRSPMPVPPLLRDAAGWVWRTLIVIAGVVVLIRFMDRIYFVVLPFFAALFATSLGYPIVMWFVRRGLPRALATWLTVLLAAVVFGGIAIFVVDRAVSQYPDLVSQIQAAVTKFRHFLTVDLHVKSSSTASLEKTITDYLNAHRNAVASGALSGIATVAETLAGVVLWFFMTFFMLYDGHNIWDWFAGLFPASSRHRVHDAGQQAWQRLGGFVHGTFIIAVFHGVVVAIALSAMGVPLVAPLALLVFMGSFLPIIGAFLFGGLAVAVTFVTQGWVLGVVLIGILVIDNQIEAHVFQPFLVGRYVELHPLAVAVSIAGGGVLEGIYGAVLAVPVVAVCYAVVKSLASGGQLPPETGAPAIESLGGDPPPPAKKAAPRKRAAAKPAGAAKKAAKKAPGAARPRTSTAR
ncbi:MAG TPA: AI-2E family transporter [Mycobacteriales bacterium]|nr:AI-2E family transporter [Mycobacteriales bacterium]